jgi:hypothetical protein
MRVSAPGPVASRRSHCVVHAIPAYTWALCDVRRVGDDVGSGDASSETAGQPAGAGADDAVAHGEPEAVADGPGEAVWPDALPAETSSAQSAARTVIMARGGNVIQTTDPCPPFYSDVRTATSMGTRVHSSYSPTPMPA